MKLVALSLLAGLAVLGAAAPARAQGQPVTTVTVVNDAHVRASALAKVERAVARQSREVASVWGTPVVRFAAGGVPLTLLMGGAPHGIHKAAPGPQRIFVWTGGGTFESWSIDFSHEVIEWLVDPGVDHGYAIATPDGGAEGYVVEIGDPVTANGYREGGVWLQDFVTPAWYHGAALSATCQGATCTLGEPMPGADGSGPYDWMGELGGPWQLEQAVAQYVLTPDAAG